MKQIATPNDSPAGPAWQLLSQIKLPAGSTANELISKWLLRALESFDLPMGLFEKIEASILDSLSRNFDTPCFSLNALLVSLSLFVPPRIEYQSAANKSWGFFRIEKSDFISGHQASQEQALEYYIFFEE